MKKLISIFLFFGLNVAAQTPVGQFIKDTKKSCLVWSEEYSETESVNWSGSCKNNYAEGKGTLTWFDNDQISAIYVGVMKGGRPNGKGKYTINNFGVLEGNFKNGLLDGRGIADYTYYGQKQKGTFSNGMLNGKGEISFNDGRHISGNFLNGVLLDLDPNFILLLKKNSLSIVDSVDIYQGDGTDQSLFYYTLTPKKVTSVLVLFPSAFESCESVISSNKTLIQNAYQSGIMTVIPSINFNRPLSIDPFAFNFVNTVFSEIQTTYHVSETKFILCGLSLGGMNAIRYTEMSFDNRFKTTIKPIAVIGIDPPVDEIGLYSRCQDEVALYTPDSLNLSPGKKNALFEGQMLINDYHQLYGGSPLEKKSMYIEHSPYTRSESNGGNAHFLLGTTLRLYCDPDINWYLKNRNRDYYHINSADLSALINFLNLNGNKKAELITHIGKGYRIDGTRHPHSWSVLEANECINWISNL